MQKDNNNTLYTRSVEKILPHKCIESIYFVTLFSEVYFNLISCDTQVIPEIEKNV